MKRVQIVASALVLLITGCHSDHSHELLGCDHDHSSEKKSKNETTTSHSHDDECNNHDHAHGHNHKHNHQNHQQYGVINIAYEPFGEVIKAGGEIIPAIGDEQILVAKHDGLAFFALKSIQEGMSLSANQHLMIITSGGLVHDNLEVGYLEAKAKFEKARTDYERASKLMADTIIPEREYLDAKYAFESSQLAFNAIRRNYESGGQKVLTPKDSFVKKIHVSEGEFVQAGQPLITISQNMKLVVKADIPQKGISKLKNIRSANFMTPYDGKIYSTTELNGKLLSWGKSTAENSFYIPIFFEVDNKDDLIPGTFIEVYLKTEAVAKSIAIPQSAIMEEFGSHFVFVDNHDDWEKRYVKLDGTDGQLVRIAEGLKVGELVATKNVSRIKLSQMTSQLPEHAHVH